MYVLLFEHLTKLVGDTFEFDTTFSFLHKKTSNVKFFLKKLKKEKNVSILVTSSLVFVLHTVKKKKRN